MLIRMFLFLIIIIFICFIMGCSIEGAEVARREERIPNGSFLSVKSIKRNSIQLPRNKCVEITDGNHMSKLSVRRPNAGVHPQEATEQISRSSLEHSTRILKNLDIL